MGKENIKFDAPLSVCWDITSRCNDDCIFCYREGNVKELELEDNTKILDNLKKCGIKKISFAGGEPLLYKYITSLLKEAKKQKIVTSMTSNGILLTHSLIRELEGVLDWLTLPLDAPNSSKQKEMTRNDAHFENIINILEYVKEMKISINLKINTVVSAINYQQIPDMCEIINQYNIKRWKLFRFFPSRGKAKENQLKYAISDEQFDSVFRKIHLPQTMIYLNNYKSFNNSYISILPNGGVCLFNKDKYEICANLLNENLLDVWNKYNFDINEHYNRNSWLIH